MSSKSGGLFDNFKRNNWTISEDNTIALFLKIQNKKNIYNRFVEYYSYIVNPIGLRFSAICMCSFILQDKE